MQYYAAYQFTGLTILGKLTAGIFASCTVLLPLTRVIPRVAHSCGPIKGFGNAWEAYLRVGIFLY